MKLHPLSVPYRALSRGTSVGATLLFVGLSLRGSGFLPDGASAAVVAGLALVGVVGVAGWQVAYYRRFEYELTDEELDIASGVVSRRYREIPLDRIQNVDISRNVIQRLLGIAVLDLETAGGGETEASLRFVSYEEAKRLQGEIQRRKRRAEVEGDADRDREADREHLLFGLTDRELAILSVLSFDLRYLSVLAFGPAAIPFVPGVAELAFVGGLVLLAVLVAGLWAVSAAVTFARFYGFRLTRVGDELRYERGLVQRYDGSIPLGKVQALTVEENVLMRRFGYASLAVETAGYAPGQTPSGGSEAAIPLASRDRVLALARDVEPFEPATFDRPPKRARRRYAMRYVLALVALAGLVLGARTVVGWPGTSALAPLAAVPLAPVAAHLKWTHRGYDAGDRHVLTRNGFWNRATLVVPYYRIQTVIRTRTAFQRRWGLASVVFDTASSGGAAAVAADRDAGEADRLRELAGERLQRTVAERRAADA